MRLPVMALCAAIALLPNQVFSGSGDFDKAMQFVRDGTPGLAVGEFTRLADDGDPFAQINLAVLLARGVGTPQNEAEAFYWAWRARIAGERRKAPDVVRYLRKRLDPKTRNRIAKRLVDDFRALADTGATEGFLGASVALMDVNEPAQPKEALVWAIMAAATNAEEAQLLRDTIAKRLEEKDRLDAQLRAGQRFREWCERASPPTSRAFCDGLSG